MSLDSACWPKIPPNVLRSIQKRDSKKETKRTGPTMIREKRDSVTGFGEGSEKDTRRLAILMAVDAVGPEGR